MKIRKASKKDWPEVLRLIREHPKHLMQHHLPRPTEFFVATLYLSKGSKDSMSPRSTRGAARSELIVGCCALEVYSRRLAEVRSLAVTRKYQGKGIATKLVERCLAEANKKRVYEVLSITGALPFFQKRGFRTFNNEKYALLKILG